MRVDKLGLAVGLMVVVVIGSSWLLAQQPARKGPAAGAEAPAAFALKAQKGLKAAPSTLEAIRNARTAKASDDEQPGEIGAYDDGTGIYVVLNLEFDSPQSCEKFKVPGAKVITRNDRWADIFVLDNEATMKAVTSAEGLVWFDYDASDIIPPPARPVPRKEVPRSIPDKIVQGGVGGLTGEGIIVAIIDTGLDFHHPDFLTYDAQGQPTSRCLYFWDTTSDAYATGVGDVADYTYPGGASIGTVYDRKTLTEEVRGNKLRIPTWDPNGHGTACAGVAGGNGNLNPKNKGVAPNVDLIGVRLAAGGGFNNGYMINAVCEWLDKIAKISGDRPLVISCSYGGQYGGHDGYFVSERHLSSRFPPEKKSRAILFAAGNEGTDGLHARATFGKQDEPGSISWNTLVEANIEIYVQTEQMDDLWVKPMPDTKYKIVESFVHPLSKHSVIVAKVKPGLGGFLVYSKSGTPYRADAYFRFGNAYPCTFLPEGGLAYENQVGSPGSSHNVLTIGSYDWNDLFDVHGETRVLPGLTVGAASDYSSPGPLRFGDHWKPEVVAPGQWYTAPAALNSLAAFSRDSTGHYQLHNGTSAATPYAAGVVALLFEAKPAMTWGEVRQVLIESASQDPAITGACPNPKWGHGKLDYDAVERAVKKVKRK